MKLEIRPRMCGKTRYLIELSDALHIPIVCPTKVDADRIFETAKRFGYHIPDPIPLERVQRLMGQSDECLVDDGDRILQMIIRARIREVTFTQEYPEKMEKEQGGQEEIEKGQP